VQAARPQGNSQPTAPAPRGLGAITGASWPSGASGAGSPIGSLLDYLLGR
jgi:hypothetical protein